MAGSLGTIRGQIRLDVANAIAGYAAVRAANATTMGAMTDARNRMRGFGLAAVGMGALFLTGFGMAVNAAADFEKKLDYFGAVNNATAAEMEKVRQKALELGRTSQYSAGQIADAFVEMGKAGVSAQDITDGMAQAMVNLASAADIDLAQATNIVTSQIQAYNLTAKDAVHVTDLMAGAANASIIDVQDIGVSMKYVAGVAHSLGITIDSTTEAISLLGKAGIKGSTAGTSLRQIMVSLAGGTKKATKVLQDLGIITADGANKFFTAEGKAKSLSEVFQILQEHTANLSDKERLMAFRTIFNNRALAAASILTKEGAKGFSEMNTEMSKTTAADVAAKRMDNLSGDVKKLKGNIETMLIKAGTPFQNFLRGIVQSITKVIQWFANLPEGVQIGIMSFMLVAGVLLVVAGTIALMGAAFAGALATLGTVGAAFKSLGIILWAATRATWALTIAALANPYVWIAIAIIALVAALVLLYHKSGAVRELFDTIGRALKTAFFATVQWFKGLPAFFSGLWDDIGNFFSKGVDWVVRKWNEFVNFVVTAPGKVGNAIGSMTNTIVTFISEAPGKVANMLSQAWNAFLAFLRDLPRMLGYSIGFVLGAITRLGMDGIIRAKQAGQAIVNGIVWFFTELPGKIAQWLGQTWGKFQTWAAQMVAQAVTTGSNVYNSVIRWFALLPGRIWNFCIDMKNKAVNAGAQLVSSTISFSQRAYNGVVTWFQKLPGRLWNFMVDMRNKAISGGAQLVSSVINFSSRAYHAVVDWVSRIPGAVSGAINNAIAAFNRMVSSAFNAAKEFAGGLWDGFKDGLGIHSPSYIEKAMWAITKVTGQETQRLKGQVRSMQGLASGLQDIHDTAARVADNPAWRNLLQAKKAEWARDLAAISPDRTSLLNIRRPSSQAQAGNRVGLEGSAGNSAITVNVYNPVAERASDTTARKLRTLSSMGAF